MYLERGKENKERSKKNGGMMQLREEWNFREIYALKWRRKWKPTPAFLPGESHGRRSLVGFSPKGCKESDTTEAT